jgi:flagellar export protein FliJ
LLSLAKFRFSLETLLRHRENLEQNARDELLRLTYNYQVEVGRRDELRARFHETMEELSLKRAENTASEELEWFYLYLNRLTQEIRESTKRLEQLDSEVQAQKIVVIEASKKRKTLDLMKAKKEKQFAFALGKQEQKEIDELVVTRFRGREPVYQGSAEVHNKEASPGKDRR